MTFGASLKRLRMERGLSQEELARRLSTSKQAISRYENGARVPKISTVSALAAALDAPLTALTGEEEVFSVPGVERPRWQRVPLLGDIACRFWPRKTWKATWRLTRRCAATSRFAAGGTAWSRACTTAI